jgi:YHS domain-containing protein
MTINATWAAAQRNIDGQTYFFCSAVCVDRFDADPGALLDTTEPLSTPHPADAPWHDRRAGATRY